MTPAANYAAPKPFWRSGSRKRSPPRRSMCRRATPRKRCPRSTENGSCPARRLGAAFLQLLLDVLQTLFQVLNFRRVGVEPLQLLFVQLHVLSLGATLRDELSLSLGRAQRFTGGLTRLLVGHLNQRRYAVGGCVGSGLHAGQHGAYREHG